METLMETLMNSPWVRVLLPFERIDPSAALQVISAITEMSETRCYAPHGVEASEELQDPAVHTTSHETQFQALEFQEVDEADKISTCQPAAQFQQTQGRSGPLRCFHVFSRLPKEIRDHIWLLSEPAWDATLWIGLDRDEDDEAEVADLRHQVVDPAASVVPISATRVRATLLSTKCATTPGTWPSGLTACLAPRRVDN